MVRLPQFARRQLVWMPTAAGWLLIALVASASIVLLVLNLYSFLAVDEPVPARVLVVEGWMAAGQLDQAVETYRQGRYSWVVTTGGVLERWPGENGHPTFAERAAAYLVAQGVPAASVVAVPLRSSPLRHRTFASALAVRTWADGQQLGARALNVVSAGPHARRSRFLYQLAFGADTEVGSVAAVPVEYEPKQWWQSSAGVGEVIEQFLAYLWVKAFFWPPERLQRAR